MIGFVLVLIIIVLIGSMISSAANRAISGELFDGFSKPPRSKPEFISSKPKRITQEEYDYHELNYREFNRGIDATTSKTAKSALERLEDGYASVKDLVPQISAECYEEDIEELRSWVEDLVFEEWGEKAENTIYQFLGLYFDILALQATDATKAASIKGRCLTKFDSFSQFTEKTINENKRHIEPSYLRNKAKELLRTLYIECAEEYSPLPCHIVFGSHDSLSSLRQQFTKNMDDHIASMKTQAKKEVTAKEPTAQKKENITVAKTNSMTSASSTYTPLIKYLKSTNQEFVDKSPKGGALYFFSQAAADHATALGYKVAYAPNGTKGTGHRPAWYVRLPE